jgi:hypothetical protein
VHIKVVESNYVSLCQNENKSTSFPVPDLSLPVSSINRAGRLSPPGFVLLAITSVGWGYARSEIAALTFTLGGVAVALRA